MREKTSERENSTGQVHRLLAMEIKLHAHFKPNSKNSHTSRRLYGSSGSTGLSKSLKSMSLRSLILVVSLVANFVLVALLFTKTMNGCAEISNGRIGVITKDVKAGIFGTDGVVFTLPKGLVVRDASATGMDRFEPHRFRLIVTSEDPELVNYADLPMQKPGGYGELYSADVVSSAPQE